ncbi:MAG TPA: type II toxin-antitoxin system PemK/MazF family toxin [Candidatus Paceibacterota bacterium]
MNRGDIYLVELPISSGHEQHGSRPALIMSDAVANTVIVVPFTSNSEATKFPNTLLVNSSKRNGLTETSIALVFQLRAIDKRRLLRKIGNMEKVHSDSVAKILRKMFVL